MSIVEQAKAELERANFGAEDTAVMVDILQRFFKQWDSGGAVAAVAPVLMRCLSGQPLSPLTGADDEWHDPMGDGLMLQNVRCGSVFKDYRNADGELAPGGTELIHDIDAPNPMASITFPYDVATRAPAMPICEFEIGEPTDAPAVLVDAGIAGASYEREPFEPIGEAMKRVVNKIKPEGEG